MARFDEMAPPWFIAVRANILLSDSGYRSQKTGYEHDSRIQLEQMNEAYKAAAR